MLGADRPRSCTAIEIYRRTVNPQDMAKALAALEGRLGAKLNAALLALFVEKFRMACVFGERKPATYLAGTSRGRGQPPDRAGRAADAVAGQRQLGLQRLR
jgi:hypothetical protein